MAGRPEEPKVILKNPIGDLAVVPKYAWCWDKLGYMPECFAKFYDKKKDDPIATGKEIVEEQQEKKKDVKIIQERMLEQICDLVVIGTTCWTQFVEKEKFELKKFDPRKRLESLWWRNYKTAHAKIVKEQYEGIYAEALENLAGTCEQLKEAYSFMDKKMKKDYVASLKK